MWASSPTKYQFISCKIRRQEQAPALRNTDLFLKNREGTEVSAAASVGAYFKQRCPPDNRTPPLRNTNLFLKNREGAVPSRTNKTVDKL